jgi:hypothetical protein
VRRPMRYHVEDHQAPFRMTVEGDPLLFFQLSKIVEKEGKSKQL